ncbi:MAG: manganese-dependent inorganic pyrophosphatase, partial [Fusobacteriales bacterium]|nr:manganese-dependent inorganic pyrophosphatase [Fusobacteriales bacterium]
AEELAVISETNLEKYGLDMLIAGTNLDDKTNEELLNMDMKIFEINYLKLAVAQVSTVDIEKLLTKKEELEKSINDFISKENLDMFMFVITDILNNNSVALAAGKRTDVAEKAFEQTMNNGILTLNGVVSRKKQIIPPLTKAVQN